MKLLLSFLNSHKVCSIGNWYSVCSVIPDTGIRIDGIVPKECALKETEIGTALYETSTLSLSWKIRNIGTTRNTMFSQISQSHKQYFARSPNGFGQWQRVAYHSSSVSFPLLSALKKYTFYHDFRSTEQRCKSTLATAETSFRAVGRKSQNGRHSGEKKGKKEEKLEWQSAQTLSSAFFKCLPLRLCLGYFSER